MLFFFLKKKEIKYDRERDTGNPRMIHPILAMSIKIKFAIVKDAPLRRSSKYFFQSLKRGLEFLR